VTELVPDHLGVLAVVHATLADRDRVLLGVVEAVVAPILVGPHDLGLVVDIREPQALDVELRLCDRVVRHDLLEPRVVAAEQERPVRAERAVLRAAHVGVVAPQVPAPVQVREPYEFVGGL
jgi:hypothetical protein